MNTPYLCVEHQRCVPAAAALGCPLCEIADLHAQLETAKEVIRDLLGAQRQPPVSCAHLDMLDRVGRR